MVTAELTEIPTLFISPCSYLHRAINSTHDNNQLQRDNFGHSCPYRPPDNEHIGSSAWQQVRLVFAQMASSSQFEDAVSKSSHLLSLVSAILGCGWPSQVPRHLFTAFPGRVHASGYAVLTALGCMSELARSCNSADT
jgi:hypothetical protein